MTFVRLPNYQKSLERKEKFIIGTILVVISMMTILDVVEDWLEGASLAHIIPEVLIICLTTGIACYLFLRFANSRQQKIELAIDQTSQAALEAKQWQEKTKELKAGLSQAITNQLKAWNLTDAEEEIAFLLIKGLSINEIAEIRNTSTQTTRQQASVIYKKSNLGGRAQLSAFFLEDLLTSLNKS